jgi:hypothetical protein
MSLTPPRSLTAIKDALAKPVIEETPKLPFNVAFVIDGVAEIVFNIDERVAAILLSNPALIQCAHSTEGGPSEGWLYNAETGTFSAPA